MRWKGGVGEEGGGGVIVKLYKRPHKDTHTTCGLDYNLSNKFFMCLSDWPNSCKAWWTSVDTT